MGEAYNWVVSICLTFVKKRHWCLAEGPSRAKMGSHKTLKIKKVLAKKQKQNRPIPQWIRMRTGNTSVTTPRGVIGGERSSSFEFPPFQVVICARFRPLQSRGLQFDFFTGEDIQVQWIKTTAPMFSKRL